MCLTSKYFNFGRRSCYLTVLLCRNRWLPLAAVRRYSLLFFAVFCHLVKFDAEHQVH